MSSLKIIIKSKIIINSGGFAESSFLFWFSVDYSTLFLLPYFVYYSYFCSKIDDDGSQGDHRIAGRRSGLRLVTAEPRPGELSNSISFVMSK
jgi:hypothetical protein